MVGVSTPIVLVYNHTVLTKSIPVVRSSSDKPADYISKSILPYIKWKHVKPCSKVLNQELEWKNTLMCASKVFTKKEMKKLRAQKLPECYVMSEKTPGIFKAPSFNYLPGYDPRESRFGATLGLYATESERIFLVENYDILQIYRHELQHHMFRILGRDKEDTGITAHTHKIWSTCEPPTYTPSKGAVKYYSKRDLNKADIIMQHFLMYSNDNSRGKVIIFTFSKVLGNK